MGKMTLDPRRLGARATLTAELGGEVARCRVVVVRTEAGPSIKIDVTDEEAGMRRASVETGAQPLIKIMGRHPVIKRYLGPFPEMPGQDSVAARLIISEIVAHEAARMVMERKTADSTTERMDASSFHVELVEYMHKYLQRAHKASIPDAEASKLH